MSDAPEHWATIPSFPAYSVSTLGRVRRDAIVHGGGGSIRMPTGVLKQRSLPLGHRQVTLCMNNQPKTILVHRLVAEAFLPPPLADQDCVCHRDDDPGNNTPSNLFWGTRADNSKDMVRKNRQRIGARVPGAKLTDDIVRDIRARVASGENQYRVARLFGIAQSNVSLIVSRRTWGHVA